MADDRQLSAAFALLCWHFCEQTVQYVSPASISWPSWPDPS